MAAKDWAPLRDALWRHVREPLLRDHTGTWNCVNPGETIPFERLGHLANGGKISANHDKATVLWYTLVYGCMHFDALSALMDRQEFQGLVRGALDRPSKKNTLSDIRAVLGRCDAARTPQPRMLHVDFGCGPGTAAWAVIKALSDRAVVTTIGHDHNAQMIELAQEMTADIVNSTDPSIAYEFYSDWDTFQKGIKWSRSLIGCDAVLVTVNSLFAQPSMNGDEIANIVGLIRLIRTTLRSLRANRRSLLSGTHPDYNRDKVRDAWRQIGNISGRRTRYDGAVQFESWSPLSYGAICPATYQPGSHGQEAVCN